MSEFNKTTDWNAAHKLCKLTEKQDKNGATFFIGDFNMMNAIYVKKEKYNDKEWWQAYVVPIRFKKVEEGTSDINI